MAKDAGTKIDQPSDQEGKGTPAKEELQTQEAAQAAQSEKGSTPSEDTGRAGAKGAEEAEKKAKPRRKPAAKKAEGTAASKTKVDKAGAEAALDEGAAEPKDADEATEAKPKAKKKPAAKTTAKAKADDKAEDKPAKGKAKPAAEKADDKPAAATKPSRRARGDQAERVTVRAHAKYVRTSARKARLVADHVRGKDVAEARAMLAFSPRSVAEDWRKLLESAIANAEHNHDLVGDNLRVLNATADEGPTLKRFRPRAMGRATRIRKRTSHLTITLTPKETR
jgi:ribosomal protein L22